MEIRSIPLEETGQFPALFTEYLAGNPELRPYYAFAPNEADFRKAVEVRSGFPCDRELLVQVLLDQYKRGGIDESESQAAHVFDNIRALRDAKTFTITTGHQLNIFTGPLYSIYKIASAIRYANRLNQTESGNRFVPVFWMATEDHDFEEISFIHLFGKKIQWNQPGTGATGRLPTAGLSALLQEINEIVPEAAWFTDILNRAYTEHQNLADATRRMYHEIFGKFGLVILDGDEPRLKAAFTDVMQEDLTSHRFFHAVNATNLELEKKYKIQVQPREINLFYLDDQVRERIVAHEKGGYDVLNTPLHFEGDELATAVKERPGNFSPNVVLRPMYQERVLPNLAYIGGPGEISYWLQFKPAFEAAGVFFPMLLPRAFLLLIDPNASARLDKLGIQPEDLFQSSDLILLEILEHSSGTHTGTESLSQALQEGYRELGESWKAIDASLAMGVEAEMQKALNGLKNLEEKARRALKKKNETQVNQVKAIKGKLFPENGLQERHDNLIQFAGSLGPGLIDKLVESITPFSNRFTILKWDA